MADLLHLHNDISYDGDLRHVQMVRVWRVVEIPMGKNTSEAENMGLGHPRTFHNSVYAGQALPGD